LTPRARGLPIDPEPAVEASRCFDVSAKQRIEPHHRGSKIAETDAASQIGRVPYRKRSPHPCVTGIASVFFRAGIGASAYGAA
jgi:hypothetical protein